VAVESFSMLMQMFVYFTFLALFIELLQNEFSIKRSRAVANYVIRTSLRAFILATCDSNDNFKPVSSNTNDNFKPVSSNTKFYQCSKNRSILFTFSYHKHLVILIIPCSESTIYWLALQYGYQLVIGVLKIDFSCYRRYALNTLLLVFYNVAPSF